MNKITTIIRAAALAIMLGALPGLAAAQQLPHEDNIWGGKNHQPTESEVVQHEKSAGIALAPQQQHRADDEIESLYRSLMLGEPRAS
jgi:hypothetical protein